ncbi:MAG: mechanosensitive ion channel [Dysgonamonadaceae bacterium]|jgi:small conductance mechanosensitive channel|nr:mechanosensitive ion channel [Dysgonamonadaceae bacterium]
MLSFKDFNFSHASWSDIADMLLHESIHFGLKLGACILIYLIGRRIIKYINMAISRLMNNREFDPSVASFLKSLINIVLTAALLIMIINILGVGNSSFVALLASIGVALGMALSGTLQNFSGGVMILLFKPYRVGDYILAQGQEGTVKEIQIFNTVIITADNRTIFIPNGGLSSNVIVNYNDQKDRRIELVIGIDYGTNYDQAKATIQSIVDKDSRILRDPAPFIALKTLNESSVDLVIRVWASTSDYWAVYFNLNEQIYKVFADQGINIPFPQMTVHLANK